MAKRKKIEEVNQNIDDTALDLINEKNEIIKKLQEEKAQLEAIYKEDLSKLGKEFNDILFELTEFKRTVAEMSIWQFIKSKF